jgi:hypothetical protein
MARDIAQDDLTPVAMLPQGGDWHMVVPLGTVLSVVDGELDAALALGRVWTLEANPQ